MKQSRFARRIAALAIVGALTAAVAAHAQATRTWVSGVGDDAMPCSRTAPCKTFAGALVKTAPGGEISVLDPGGFGAVTINKSITINGEGTVAGIQNSVVTGIFVNAGATDRVTIRNISIQGTTQSPGLNGIRFLAGASLVLDRVHISVFSGRGIDMSHNSNGKLFVRDSVISNGATGIFVTTTAGLAQASLDNVTLTHLSTGIEGGANSRVTVSDSAISNNTTNGVLASAGTTRINVDGCQVSLNDGVALNAAAAGSIIRLGNNHIYNNINAIAIAAGASVESAGDNRVAGNAASQLPNGSIPVL